MEWLAENWIWVLVGVLFVGMHLFGHGGHGGHEAKGKPDTDAAGTDKPADHRH